MRLKKSHKRLIRLEGVEDKKYLSPSTTQKTTNTSLINVIKICKIFIFGKHKNVKSYTIAKCDKYYFKSHGIIRL